MPKINKEIFKSYDIRGIYPDDLNLDIAHHLAWALIGLTNAKTVVVGRDMRLGGKELLKKLCDTLVKNGVKVIDIGLVPIDAMYFSVGKYAYDVGIMVTASHNPKEYNGFKTVFRDKNGIKMIRGVDILKYILNEKEENKIELKNGLIEQKDIWHDYIEHVFSFVDEKKFRPLKIVIDAGNGMAGKVIPLLEKRLPAEIIKMNFKLDGSFPSHPSNPLEIESHEPLQKKVLEEKADIGFIFDGDADRIFVVDNKGNFLRGDTVLIFLAKYFLDNNLGDTFVYNAICSKAVSEMIEKMGGRAFREKVGYVNLSQRMKKENGVLSGEVSGHYSFAKNYYVDSGFIAFLIILQVLSASKNSLNKMMKDFNPYFRGDEINIKVNDILIKMEKIRQEYNGYKQDELDGVTVDGWDKEGWWINVRPSNTEPLLRITVEAKDKEMLKKKQQEVMKVIEVPAVPKVLKV